MTEGRKLAVGRARDIRTDIVGGLESLGQQRSSRSFTVLKEARSGVDT